MTEYHDYDHEYYENYHNPVLLEHDWKTIDNHNETVLINNDT